MFNLFKKKAPEPEKEAAPSPNRQLVEKYGPFAEETVELSAVTGSIGFGVLPQDAEGNPDGPWAAVLPLTAWYEDDEPVTQGKARLVAVADRRLLAHLQRMAPRDSIIQVKARPSQQENTYLMTDLPSRFMDPELKAILTYGTDQGAGANEAAMINGTINKDEFAVFTIDTAEFIRNKVIESANGESVLRGTVMLGEGTPMTCYNLMDGSWMDRVVDSVYSEECIKITPETIGNYFPAN